MINYSLIFLIQFLVVCGFRKRANEDFCGEKPVDPERSKFDNVRLFSKDKIALEIFNIYKMLMFD